MASARGDSRVVPELEEVGADVGQGAGVLAHQAQVLLGQLPHGRAAALEQGGVVQVALCRGKGGSQLRVLMSPEEPTYPQATSHHTTGKAAAGSGGVRTAKG